MSFDPLGGPGPFGPYKDFSFLRLFFLVRRSSASASFGIRIWIKLWRARARVHTLRAERPPPLFVSSFLESELMFCADLYGFGAVMIVFVVFGQRASFVALPRFVRLVSALRPAWSRLPLSIRWNVVF